MVEEAFSKLSNKLFTDDPTALDVISQKAATDYLDLLATLDEAKKVIKQTKIKKASGVDGLTDEIFKAVGVPGYIP